MKGASNITNSCHISQTRKPMARLSFSASDYWRYYLVIGQRRSEGAKEDKSRTESGWNRSCQWCGSGKGWHAQWRAEKHSRDLGASPRCPGLQSACGWFPGVQAHCSCFPISQLTLTIALKLVACATDYNQQPHKIPAVGCLRFPAWLAQGVNLTITHCSQSLSAQAWECLTPEAPSAAPFWNSLSLPLSAKMPQSWVTRRR